MRTTHIFAGLLSLVVKRAFAQTTSANPAWGLGAFGGQIGVFVVTETVTTSTTAFLSSPTTISSLSTSLLSSMSTTSLSSSPSSSDIAMIPMDFTASSAEPTSTSTSTELTTTSTTTIYSTITITQPQPTATSAPAKAKRAMMFVDQDQDDMFRPLHHAHSSHRRPVHDHYYDQSSLEISATLSSFLTYIKSFSSRYAYDSATTQYQSKEHCARHLASTFRSLDSKSCLGNDVVSCNRDTGRWEVLKECGDVGKICRATKSWDRQLDNTPVRSAQCG